MDMLEGAQSIQDFLKIKFTTLTVRNEEDAEAGILQLKKDGVRVVIGGVMSTKIAADLGLDTIFIHTGPEAIRQAIREAKRVGTVRRREQERNEQLRAILNCAAEGILAIDGDGCISLANTAAVRLAGLSENPSNLKLDEVCPELELGRVLATGNPQLGEIRTVDGHQIAVNSIPVIIKDQVAGVVATLHPVTAIQELERRIRQKIHQRGLVAKFRFSDILGQSPAIKNTVKLAREFSKVESSVLIVGATGTGKEMLAQSIHNGSHRSQGPFVAVNCAALPEDLLESELFGYVEGAFTGALHGGKMGLFELAHRGTIFLDEIADISPKLQARLLRVIQEREIMRLGDNKIIPVDVRIVVATNRDLLKIMKEGKFRDDLYYRLDILRVIVPTLVERTEDIVPIMRHFLRMYCTKFAKQAMELTKEAEEILETYSWPGNVRELRNIAERLAVVTAGDVICGKDLAAVSPQLVKGMSVPAKKPVAVADRDDEEQMAVLRALEKTDYHYGRAAAELGIGRTTLWRKLKRMGGAKDDVAGT
jgi:transcriptional regulator with PAS, ATPase and Fis domain